MFRATASTAPLAAAIALALSIPAFAAQPETAVNGRILVQTRAGLSEIQLDKVLKGQGARRMGRIGKLDLHLAQVPPQAQEAMLRALRNNPHIEFAEPDRLVALTGYVANDPQLANAWHLPVVGAPDAWLSTLGQGVTVAVLDSGVDPSHPDLISRLVTGYNAVDGSSSTSDLNGHGTAVAGSAAAATDNGTGVASVAGKASIMPIRVSNRSDGYAYWSDIARGLTWAADNGAEVANISYMVTASSAVNSAAQYMTGKGGVVMVSAGNDGVDPGYSDSPYMITVSATDKSGSKASWSSYGYFVDVTAPGDYILTTNNGGGYGQWRGTSFSSPVAAGVAALVLAANPNLSPLEVEAILESTAQDLGPQGWDTYHGYGQVSAAAAVAAALSIEILDSQAPSVSILSPMAGSVAGVVPVDIATGDNVATIRVELLANGVPVASDSAEPFAFSWDSTAHAEGSVTLTARAYDAAGNVGLSKAVAVTVDNVADPVDVTPPTVVISSPGDGSTVSGTVSIRIGAKDNVALAEVACYVDGRLLGVTSSGDLTCNWNTRKVSSGTHTLLARATDTSGNVTDTAISVTVGGGTTVKGRGNGTKGNKG